LRGDSFYSNPYYHDAGDAWIVAAEAWATGRREADGGEDIRLPDLAASKLPIPRMTAVFSPDCCAVRFEISATIILSAMLRMRSRKHSMVADTNEQTV